jgi:hypothetical protein
MPAIALQDHDLKSEETKINSDNWLLGKPGGMHGKKAGSLIYILPG